MVHTLRDYDSVIALILMFIHFGVIQFVWPKCCYSFITDSMHGQQY
jgi:hypothetical protein